MKERKRLFKCGRERERDETRVVHELKRKSEREEEAEEEIPVPTEWESNTFSAVPRFRSAPDPPPYLPSTSLIRSPPRPPSYTSSDLPKVSSARLPSRRLYAKCIYVLCKASNRRWPREPDAQCVINTDALVVPFPPSPTVPFTYSSSRSTPCLCRSSRASETHRSSQ